MSAPSSSDCWFCIPGNPCREHKRPPLRPSTPLDLVTTDEYERRVRGAIEATCRTHAAKPEGRNPQLFGSLRGALNKAKPCPSISEDWIVAMFEQAHIENGSMADNGRSKFEGTVRSAKKHSATDPPEYLEERENPNPAVAPAYVLDPSTADAAACDPTEDRRRRIESRAEQLRLDREARALVDAEGRPEVVLPPLRSLTKLLAEPDQPVQYVIDRLALETSNTIISAAAKAGKTTVLGNLFRSFADGTPFLGEFAVAPGRRVALVDDELGSNTLRRWMRDQGIENTDAIADIADLRGNVGAFNLLDEKVRAQWATRFRDLGVGVLTFDCLRPVLDALGLDEHRDAGVFLVAFEALLREADIPVSIIVHHMGHSGERSRGDSRLIDWPDATWRILRDNSDDPDNPSAPRFFSAYGRDVNVPEGRLDFDGDTRRLTYVEGSRKSAKAAGKIDAAMAALPDILRAADVGDGLSQNALRERLQLRTDCSFAVARGAIQRAVTGFMVLQNDGPNRTKLHILNPSWAAA